MNTIQVNGVTITAPAGSNVKVVNGKVSVNGKQVAEIDNRWAVDVSGSENFNLHCEGNVTVNGNVNGSVECKRLDCHSVGGSVTSTGDSVNAGNIGGSVSAGGDVSAQNVGGSINCGGSING